MEACHYPGPGLSPGDVLYLNYGQLILDKELAMVTLLSTGLAARWKARKDNMSLTSVHLKAALTVRYHALKGSDKFAAAGIQLELLTNPHPLPHCPLSESNHATFMHLSTSPI